MLGCNPESGCTINGIPNGKGLLEVGSSRPEPWPGPKVGVVGAHRTKKLMLSSYHRIIAYIYGVCVLCACVLAQGTFAEKIQNPEYSNAIFPRGEPHGLKILLTYSDTPFAKGVPFLNHHDHRFPIHPRFIIHQRKKHPTICGCCRKGVRISDSTPLTGALHTTTTM
jgi:hypothetical protein